MRVTHLNGLRALEAALRSGSLRAAAEELGVTSAAVGQQIRNLESFLGRELLSRSTAGISPGPQALGVQHKLTSSFLALDEILRQLKQRKAGNRLALTLPSSFAENWVTGRLA